MSRANYKMRKVVEKLTITSKSNPAVQLPRERLECGHVIRVRIGGPRSKSEAIRELFHAMSGEPVVRRCFECAKESETK